MKKRIVVISLILIFVVLTATFAGGCSGKYFKYEDFDIKLDVVKGDDNVISVCVALRNKSVKSGLVKGGSQLIYITCESENGEFDRDYPSIMLTYYIYSKQKIEEREQFELTKGVYKVYATASIFTYGDNNIRYKTETVEFVV